MLNTHILSLEFAGLLSTIFGPIEYSDAPLRDLAIQRNVELLLEPEELEVSLDDFAEKKLMPCASLLARNMKESDAAVTFRLVLPAHAIRSDLYCSTVLREGMWIRCLLDEPKQEPKVPPHMAGKYVLRFDVLFRTKEQQLAA